MQRVRLHEQALELDAIEKLAQGLDLAAAVGGVGALGDRHVQAVGIQAHLGDETRCAGGILSNRAPESFAIAHQSVDSLTITDLGVYPGLEQVLKAFHVELS